MSNAIIARFAEPTPITIERTAAGVYNDDGAFVPGAVTELEMVAAVLPAESDEIKMLNSGRENRGGIMVYTQITDVIRTSSEHPAKTPADVILWDDRRWLVVKADRMAQIKSLAHCRAIALEEDVV